MMRAILKTLERLFAWHVYNPDGRAPWNRLYAWYSWRCAVCGRRDGMFQLSNLGLRCDKHRIDR